MPKPHPLSLVIAIVGGVPLVFGSVFALVRKEANLAPREDRSCNDPLPDEDAPKSQPTQASLESSRSSATQSVAVGVDSPVAAATEITQPVATEATPYSDHPEPLHLPESTLAEMNVKRSALQSMVSEYLVPIAKARFEQGQFEHISDDPHWSPTRYEYDRRVIRLFRCNDAGWDCAQVARDQYPEVYVYYDERLRLDDLINQTERERPTTGK